MTRKATKQQITCTLDTLAVLSNIQLGAENCCKIQVTREQNVM